MSGLPRRNASRAVLLFCGVVLVALAGAAQAAEPVYKASPATIESASGWYLSLDGAWQTVKLQNYALGIRSVSGITPPPARHDLGIAQSFSQRHDGYLVRGAVGFLLPRGDLSVLGTNTRLEFGGLYGDALGSQSAVSEVGPSAALQVLDGSGGSNRYNCSANTCTVASAQSTDYSNWQVHGKVAGDHRFGNIVLTPSLALFGGEARNKQTLAQDYAQVGPGPRTATYDASTMMRWNDLGARAGLNVRVDLSNSVAVSVGGLAGFARRHVSFSGTDVGIASLPNERVLDGASALSLKDNATPFIANLEGGVAWKWLPALTVRGFAGLNYDSRVPGIVGPSFIGDHALPSARIPASISFQSETSYYAGGGAIWAF